MYYLIQNNLFRQGERERLIDALERLDLEYEAVDAPPFINPIQGIVVQTNRTDIFAFGALQMAFVSHEYNWNPGMLMTPNHSYEVYKDYYKEHLLNYNCEIYRLDFYFDWKKPQYFIRPTKDTKLFDGQVFTEEEWHKTRTKLLIRYQEEAMKTLIQVGSPKEIYKEIRFFIVGDKVVTGSQYRLGQTSVIYSDIIDQDAYDFAYEMIKIFKLADAFIMDICLTPDGWKIVECGCINCAGFYRADIQKLVYEIETYFGEKRD